MVSLDRFIVKEKKTDKEEPPPPRPKEERPPPERAEEEPEEEEVLEAEETELEAEAEGPAEEEIVEKTIFEAETPQNTGTLYLLSVTYSGAKNKALLKLYDVERGKIVFWYDNTGHRPYLLTDLPLSELLSDLRITSHPGFDGTLTAEVEKYDLLHDRKARMTKVVAKDPLSIGGRGSSLREILENSWEDNIRYYECYTYDLGLIPGYTYRIKDGQLVREDRPLQLDDLKAIFKDLSPEHMKSLMDWFPLFVVPVPDYRRVALDIEVATEAVDRIPDPSVAKNQVICASLVASDGLNIVLLLKRSGTEEGLRPPDLPNNVNLVYFDEELSLIKEIFKYLLDYPIVLTFNGDNFDLHYLWRRAQVLGMKKEEIPVQMGREIALLPTGVHIDLYKFLHNHAIQVYAFGNSYREVTLDSVAGVLLDIKKIPIEKTVTELDYLALASYCYRDALIVLRLSSENSSLIMNLITMIMRISRMSMEDVTRQGISRWIRSLFFYEHRARNYLIPRQSDIEAMKGEASTTAIIKGKKYLGAIVIKPESNVYFDVVVLDFASLYPSIISRWNLSYETVRCVHESCKSNLVPDTKHWVCTKRVGLMSLVIGLLKDVRVKWFKQKSKDPSLSPEERNWYKVVQQALKVFLNASYGVFGAEIFPLYCLPLADSTTAIGRHIIKETINKAKELGVPVIYADTDSLFLYKPTKDQISQIQAWAESRFGIDLEVDKRYTFVTFSGRKKNYLGVMDTGVVDIKGLMGKKRNTPVFIKLAFNEMTQVLKDVKSPQDFDRAKAKIKEIVQNCYANLKSRRYTLDELAFRVMLSRPVERYQKTTPQHVKAAKQLKEKGKEVKPGDIISYVKVQGPIGVKPIQLARVDEVDADKYVGHIETTFGQVLDALGIEFDEIVGIKKLEFFTR
ncbi:MAG: DNA-directed DNA polymerase I [Candidatus Methanomethyliaceae archaeon]|nr:DNA-directed DNA polymerase I [Candidatus Methanomethyliaceae archaeon]